MNAYITLGARDSATSNAFYDAVLATIGWSSHMNWPGWHAYSQGGSGEGLTLWVCTPFDGGEASAGNGTMVALGAASQEQVDAFHAAAMAHGGTDDGAPGPRPDYGSNWYSAYLRDPTGNKLAVVFNG